MKAIKNYNDEVTEFTILEDYTKPKFIGYELIEVQSGKMEKVKKFKDITTKNVKSKITVYNAQIKVIREVINSKNKPYKDRCMIGLESNNVFIVNSNYEDVRKLTIKELKISKIGF